MAAIMESTNEAAWSGSRNMGYKRKLGHINDIQTQGEFQGVPSRDNELTNAKWNWRRWKKVRKTSENISAGEEKNFIEWKRDQITNLFHTRKTKPKQYWCIAFIHFRCRSWAQTRSWAKFWEKNIQGVHAVVKFCSTKRADMLMTAWSVKSSDLEWKIMRKWGYKCQVLNKMCVVLLCCVIIYPIDIRRSIFFISSLWGNPE